jgi:NTE family protein
MTKNSPNTTQRALILQGGGALGAYEVGALQEFCSSLALEDEINSDRRKNQPMFDIVAGSSIGAVNAAILVDNVIHPKDENAEKSKIWSDAVDTLDAFYAKISERGGNMHPMWWVDNVFLKNPIFDGFWPYWENIKTFYKTQNDLFFDSPFTFDKKVVKDFVANSPLLDRFYFNMFPDTWGVPASGELARKYYSYMFSVFLGSPGVLSPAMTQPDMKFLDPFYFTQVFARFNNAPLAETMKKFCHLPLKIKTEKNDEKTHPRLLVISVDVEDITTPVVFDSFSNKEKENDTFSWHSKYGLDSDNNSKFRIDYDNGIEMKHVEASMATPIRYDYPRFPVTNIQENKTEERTFWDGAFLANTPLRQVMRSHRQYWLDRGEEDKIPELEIFIVNLYPSVEHGIPTSPDAIQDRQTDLTFHDRTKYQVKVDKMRSQYIDALQKLMPVSGKQNAETEAIERALLKGRFKLGRVVYVERKEKSGDTIFAKAFDFSPETIRQLKEEGRLAAEDAFVKCTQEYEINSK